jgi:hypothetical protein
MAAKNSSIVSRNRGPSAAQRTLLKVGVLVFTPVCIPIWFPLVAAIEVVQESSQDAMQIANRWLFRNSPSHCEPTF